MSAMVQLATHALRRGRLGRCLFYCRSALLLEDTAAYFVKLAVQSHYMLGRPKAALEVFGRYAAARATRGMGDPEESLQELGGKIIGTSS